jgi:hypothetical protein
MIHVHTFNDLSEANLAPTWGARFALGRRDKVFRHNNPYRTLEVSDHFGKYAEVPNPPADKEHRHITIAKAYWHDARETPAMIRQYVQQNPHPSEGRLFLRGQEWFKDAGDYLQYKLFLKRCDPHFALKAKGQPDIACQLSLGFFTSASDNVRDMELLIPAAEYAKMTRGVAYTLHPLNAGTDYHWKVKDGLTISMHVSLEEKLDALLERLDKMEKRLQELEKKHPEAKTP